METIQTSNEVVEKIENTNEKINLDDILLDLDKGYNLDSLPYPNIKKNILRAFGMMKNIILDNGDDMKMSNADWDRLHNNISKYVLILKDKIADIDKIINIKNKEFNDNKAKLKNIHEDIKVVEDELAPIQFELDNLKIRRGNLSKEHIAMKAIKTQVFAKERKFHAMFRHTQILLGLAVIIRDAYSDKWEMFDDFCQNHDENTKAKLKGYINDIINDEWIKKVSSDNESFISELAELTENNLDEQKEQAEYFKNLALGTMYKLAEMFQWEFPIKPDENDPNADNLMASQISKKLNNVINGTSEESSKFTKEDKERLADFVKFTDIFIGQGLENMLTATKSMSDDFKRNSVKLKFNQMALLAKHVFKNVEVLNEDEKNRLMCAIVLSTCKLDTLSILFYMM